jgi:hypothetical protein
VLYYSRADLQTRRNQLEQGYLKLIQSSFSNFQPNPYDGHGGVSVSFRLLLSEGGAELLSDFAEGGASDWCRMMNMMLVESLNMACLVVHRWRSPIQYCQLKLILQQVARRLLSSSDGGMMSWFYSQNLKRSVPVRWLLKWQVDKHILMLALRRRQVRVSWLGKDLMEIILAHFLTMLQGLQAPPDFSITAYISELRDPKPR